MPTFLAPFRALPVLWYKSTKKVEPSVIYFCFHDPFLITTQLSLCKDRTANQVQFSLFLGQEGQRNKNNKPYTTSTNHPENHGKKKESEITYLFAIVRNWDPNWQNPVKNSFIIMLCQRTWNIFLTSAVTRPIYRIQLIQVCNGGFAKITPSQI